MNTVRMTISVPSKLKAKMDEVNGVVWSSVASDAFRLNLAENESRKAEVKTMRDVVERMRAAMNIEANEDKQRGQQDGRHWARKRAEPRELQRLEAARDDRNWDEVIGCANAPDNAFGFSAVLAGILTGDENIDRRDANRYWANEGINEDDLSNDDYAEAFVDGAIQVWAEVQEALRNHLTDPVPPAPEKPKRGRPPKKS